MSTTSEQRDKWENWIIGGGPMPILGEDWPEIPQPEGWPFEAKEGDEDESL